MQTDSQARQPEEKSKKLPPPSHVVDFSLKGARAGREAWLKQILGSKRLRLPDAVKVLSLCKSKSFWLLTAPSDARKIVREAIARGDLTRCRVNDEVTLDTKHFVIWLKDRCYVPDHVHKVFLAYGLVSVKGVRKRGRKLSGKEVRSAECHKKAVAKLRRLGRGKHRLCRFTKQKLRDRITPIYQKAGVDVPSIDTLKRNVFKFVADLINHNPGARPGSKQ